MSLVGTYKVGFTSVKVTKGSKEGLYNYRYIYWPVDYWERNYSEDTIEGFIRKEGWIKQSQLPDKSDIED